MHRLSDIYFVGGFGTVQWVDVAEYVAATPDQIVRSQPHQALQVMILRLSWLNPKNLIPSPHPDHREAQPDYIKVLDAARYTCAGVK